MPGTRYMTNDWRRGLWPLGGKCRPRARDADADAGYPVHDDDGRRGLWPLGKVFDHGVGMAKGEGEREGKRGEERALMDEVARCVHDRGNWGGEKVMS